MKRKLFVSLLAVFCVLSMGVTALAAEATLSKDSKASAVPQIYNYEPLRTDSLTGRTVFGNTVTCAAIERVYDDRGDLYRVSDASVLADPLNFQCTTKITDNPMVIRTVKKSDEPIVGTGVPFLVTLQDDYVYQNVVACFSVTYTAKRDVTLPVTATGSNAGKSFDLMVQSGATIQQDYRLNINSDTLFRTNFDDYVLTGRWYGDIFLENDIDYPAGAEDLVISPRRDWDSECTWEDTDIIVAELNGGDFSYYPKLSTQRSDTGLVDDRTNVGQIYTRFFRGNPTSSSKATLTLTNPFLNFDGEEMVPHQDVYIYEVRSGVFYDVTKKFRYTTDSDDRGAFQIQTDTLGNYVFSGKKLL